ncbi:MAG TPA: peptide ligase PGM1-related protein [Acidobacteriota bacterium]
MQDPLQSLLEKLPPIDLAEEKARFKQLQERLPELERYLRGNPAGEQTVVVIPSLTLNQDELSHIDGVDHYEERMLFFLSLLRLPRIRVVLVTSRPIEHNIIDYFLSHLEGIPFTHARSRLILLSTHDSSPVPLTFKILERPRLLERISKAICDPSKALMTCFNVTVLERRLAVVLGIPLYGTDPELNYLGTKSGSRKLFRDAGVDLPAGFEDLRDEKDVVQAIDALWAQMPDLRRVVIKLDDSFSGEGNALLDLRPIRQLRPGEASESRRLEAIAEQLPKISLQARRLDYEGYFDRFRRMHGIVEEFLEGEVKESPSVQLRVTPSGELRLISTHDQLLGGPDGQVFIGCRFPARAEYRVQLMAAGMAIGEVCRRAGVLGRFGIDFIAVPNGRGGWRLCALENNLRKGGTTHPFLTLQFLTAGTLDPITGEFHAPDGTRKYYVASDNLVAKHYRGCTPEDLIDLAVLSGLVFQRSREVGVLFHLLGSLSQYGKLGATCIENSPAAAEALYRRVLSTLDAELRRAWIPYALEGPPSARKTEN